MCLIIALRTYCIAKSKACNAQADDSYKKLCCAAGSEFFRKHDTYSSILASARENAGSGKAVFNYCGRLL